MNEIRLIALVSFVAILTSACGGSDGGGGSNSGNDDVTTPVEPSSPTMAEDIAFSELMVNPNTLDNSLGQWFEVRNPGVRELNLRDCVFSDAATSNFSIDSDMFIDAGEYLTFAISANPGFVPDLNFNGSGLTLTIPADILTLTCNGIVIDSHNYTISSPGSSSSLSNNKGNVKWCDDMGSIILGLSDTGTPGLANINCN